MNKLIAKAKKSEVNKKNKITNEVVELAREWAKGNVGLAGVCEALDIPRSHKVGAYCVLARALKEIVNKYD